MSNIDLSSSSGALKRLLEDVGKLKEDQTKQKSLADAKEKVPVGQVERFGDKLLIPEKMTLTQAKRLIESREQYEEEETVMQATFQVFPWDGAAALQRVLEAKFGWAQSKGQELKGIFGDTIKIPAQTIEIEVDYGKTVNVPWGEMSLPTIPDGKIVTAGTIQKGQLVFGIVATVRRKHEAEVTWLFDAVREELKRHSIYKGKAVKINFSAENGLPLKMPEITFMPQGVDANEAVYSRHTEAQLYRDLFVPIKRAADLLANGIPVKRGVLLTGTFGTGKTLAATVASKLATDAGIMYLYVPKAADLPKAIDFARQYQSPAAVVFCEDIDRTANGARTAKMDSLLNIIDGVDGKTSNIIVVLTTNDLQAINPAMIRPGRLDSIIEITAPDQEAVQRLVRRYAGPLLAVDADLSAVGQALAGTIPAVIVEVVRRAKLAQLARQAVGTLVEFITAQSLLDAADSMQAQIGILRKASSTGKRPTKAEALAKLLVQALVEGFDDNEQVDFDSAILPSWDDDEEEEDI